MAGKLTLEDVVKMTLAQFRIGHKVDTQCLCDGARDHLVRSMVSAIEVYQQSQLPKSGPPREVLYNEVRQS